jgi:hypothetical protein
MHPDPIDTASKVAPRGIPTAEDQKTDRTKERDPVPTSNQYPRIF